MPNSHPLSPGASTVAVLDTNVLLPPRLSDLLFDLFLCGLYHPRWTPTIEEEFIRNFGSVFRAKDVNSNKAIKIPMLTAERIAKAKHRLHCFRSTVGPEHEVLLYDQPFYRSMVPSTVNAGDKHVAAAALVLHTIAQQEGTADKVFILSRNLKHLAVKEMAVIGVDVISPGAFIDKLNLAAPARVEIALKKTINDLIAPRYTKEDMLMLLLSHGASQTAKFYAARWKTMIPPTGCAPREESS